MAAVPSAPGHGLTSQEAQAWVLVAAIVTAMVYGFRKAIETVTPSSSTTGGVKQLAGAGPPPSVERWVVSYGTAFILLAIVSVASPETAGSLSILIVVGTLLANGQAVAKDIGSLEGKT